MKFIDLFSGIGGFRTGLEKAGHECLAFCEIDKYARQSYKAMHNTEGEVEWHDITAVSDNDFRLFRGRVDIIAGGFPCQAFSVAGKRAGFDDTRGTLFFEIARAAKEIEPSYLFLENVKGLFSHDGGNTFRVILQTLDELGFIVEWGLFNSKYWGVAQNRERVFILATKKERFVKPKLFDLVRQQAEVKTRLRDILETDVDEKYYLSEEKTANLLRKLDGKTTGGKDSIEWHGSLKTGEKGVPRDYIDTYGVMGTGGVSQCLRTMQGGNREPKIAEPQIIQTARGNNKGGRHSVAPTVTTNSYQENKHLAEPHAVSIDAGMKEGATKIRKDDLASTIPASYFKGLCGQGRPFVYELPKYCIRKLTPLECFRLQGFTDEQFRKAEAVNSNSQLYKQAGNSVTVNVIHAIASCLID